MSDANQSEVRAPAMEQRLETLAEFRASFAYGSRTDLLFKFLKRLSDDEAAEFVRALLEGLGESADDGDFGRVLDLMYEWNVRGYAPATGALHGNWIYEDGPFRPLAKPLAQSRLALFTTTGHFVEGDDPRPFGVENMSQEAAVGRIGEFLKAEAILSRIPVDTPRENLRVRHPGYDIRAVRRDPNVALPLDRLRELAAGGALGALHEEAYSFVGATAQTPLLRKFAPEWAGMLRAQEVDAVLLVPV